MSFQPVSEFRSDVLFWLSNLKVGLFVLFFILIAVPHLNIRVTCTLFEPLLLNIHLVLWDNPKVTRTSLENECVTLISKCTRIKDIYNYSVVPDDNWGMRLRNSTLNSLCQSSSRSQEQFRSDFYIFMLTHTTIYVIRPPRWSSGQYVWLLIMRSRVRSPALPQILNVD